MADRVRKLKETHEKIRERISLTGQDNNEIEELENIPAYVRKKDHHRPAETLGGPGGIPLTG